MEWLHGQIHYTPTHFQEYVKWRLKLFECAVIWYVNFKTWKRENSRTFHLGYSSTEALILVEQWLPVALNQSFWLARLIATTQGRSREYPTLSWYFGESDTILQHLLFQTHCYYCSRSRLFLFLPMQHLIRQQLWWTLESSMYLLIQRRQK